MNPRMGNNPAPERRAGTILLHELADLASFDSSDSLLLLDTAQLALGNKPALAADRAEHAALNNLFAEALQKLFLRLIGA